MSAAFADVLRGEWLKQRRTWTAWMVVACACFTPSIVLAMRLLRYRGLPALHAAPDYWERLWHAAWESSAIFFLPMGAVLATSLVVQVEFRNQAWKLVHVLPARPWTLYFAKLAVVASMIALFVAAFCLATWMTAAIPALLVPGVDLPSAPIPWSMVARDGLGYFVGALPIVALQYAVALRFANVMVPVGMGFMLWVGTLGMLGTGWGSLSPYAATMVQYIASDAGGRMPPPLFEPHAQALAYFACFVAVGYALFAGARNKG
ncbi:ABC transporter permease [Thermomonas brevis]|uniref:ABC transporter permease n=1 Tax=Thermomonas brevis TaxID=215691 RepID=A0A7G9QT91_9GAMM|nr:ABC transporter permease [Thermomonas brevis]QNN46566.1 ABC transporter permease [Thermomonas brevis]